MFCSNRLCRLEASGKVCLTGRRVISFATLCSGILPEKKRVLPLKSRGGITPEGSLRVKAPSGVTKLIFL